MFKNLYLPIDTIWICIVRVLLLLSKQHPSFLRLNEKRNQNNRLNCSLMSNSRIEKTPNA